MKSETKNRVQDFLVSILTILIFGLIYYSIFYSFQFKTKIEEFVDNEFEKSVEVEKQDKQTVKKESCKHFWGLVIYQEGEAPPHINSRVCFNCDIAVIFSYNQVNVYDKEGNYYSMDIKDYKREREKSK